MKFTWFMALNSFPFIFTFACKFAKMDESDLQSSQGSMQRIIAKGQFFSDAIEGPVAVGNQLIASNWSSLGMIGAMDLDTKEFKPVLKESVSNGKLNGLFADDGLIYAADEKGQRILKVDQKSGNYEVLTSFEGKSPNDIILFNKRWLIITVPLWEEQRRGELWSYDLQNAQLANLASEDLELNGLALGQDDILYVNNHNKIISYQLDIQNETLKATKVASSAELPSCSYMDGMKFREADKSLYVACYNNNRIAKISITNWEATAIDLMTESGNPTNLVFSLDENSLFVTTRNSKYKGESIDILEIVL